VNGEQILERALSTKNKLELWRCKRRGLFSRGPKTRHWRPYLAWGALLISSALALRKQTVPQK